MGHMTVELRANPSENPEVELLGVWLDDELVGTVTVRSGRDAACASIALHPQSRPRLSDMRDAIAGLVHHFRQRPRLELEVSDLLLRHEARSVGFEGPIRGPLV